MIDRSSTALEIAAAVRSGAVSAVDVAEAALSRIKTDNPPTRRLHGGNG
jgi:1-carboxybiuret hydrolase